MEPNNQWFSERILKRLLSYVVIDTMSDRHADVMPSTPGQWDLIRLLEREMRDLGISDITLDRQGYLIARIPGNRTNGHGPAVGFMAHVDTSSDLTGKGVVPQVHRSYDLSPITLGHGYILDPAVYPSITRHRGETIVTASGDTLLGADDKAGIAEILTAAEWILTNPDIPHGEIELIFTPDEETGKGLTNFPVKLLNSIYCYTLDGEDEPKIETECFNAYGVKIEFTGKVIHLGSARGQLINAVEMAGKFLAMLPQNESPEATDGRYGYYCPLEIRGSLDSAVLEVFLRDFELTEIDRRAEALSVMARAVEAIFPGGKVTVTVQKQYLNMREHMKKEPRGLQLLLDACRSLGMEPELHIIRGGTDGAKLSEMGIPTPNIFVGGDNFHSRYEWVSLESMTRASLVVERLMESWGRER
jgi:tripeptide aminopeptidase